PSLAAALQLFPVEVFLLLGRGPCSVTQAGGCSEPRSRHCTPAWVTDLKFHFQRLFSSKTN
uniref:Uncharacterized protein n=1 Tax=Macaca fascicularis TaxID=9541 RepID=A0A7N9D458_MACFA